MPIIRTLSPPSQAIEVVVTATEGEEEQQRALEPEEEIPTDFLQSPVVDGPLKEPIHRRHPVSLKRRSLFTPNHVRRDSQAGYEVTLYLNCS